MEVAAYVFVLDETYAQGIHLCKTQVIQDTPVYNTGYTGYTCVQYRLYLCTRQARVYLCRIQGIQGVLCMITGYTWYTQDTGYTQDIQGVHMCTIQSIHRVYIYQSTIQLMCKALYLIIKCIQCNAESN